MCSTINRLLVSFLGARQKSHYRIVVHASSHVGTLVPECYKDDVESQWKSLKFDHRHPKRLNRWLPKLAGVTKSRISTPVQNFITIRLRDFALTYAKLLTKSSIG